MSVHFELIDSLRQHLPTIPELGPSIVLAEKEPDLIDTILARYKKLLTGMAAFGETEFAQAKVIRDTLAQQEQEFSASNARLSDVCAALGDQYKDFMETLFDNCMDTSSATTREGLSQFIERLEGGHELKVSGHTISDRDDKSDVVIWGHTLITNPVALWHFLIIHYIERVACAQLRSLGLELGNHKDFFLNGMIDAVIIDTRHEFTDLFGILSMDREDGGVGWQIATIKDISGL